MLKPYKMSRLVITGPNTIQETVIKELHKLEILHIVEHTKNELADIGKPLESANKFSEILVKVRALITALNIKKEDIEVESKTNLMEIEQTTKKLNDQLNSYSEELRKIEEQISKNEALKKEIEILKDVDISLDAFASYKSLNCFTGYVADQDTVAYLKKELSKITSKFMLFDAAVEKKIFVALFVDAKSREKIIKILQIADFSPVNLTNLSNLTGTASSNLIRIEKENIKLRNQSDDIKKQIEKLGHENKIFLRGADEFLSQELEKAEAPLKFAVTKDAFFIKGWVPTVELNNTIDRLNKATKNKVFIHSEPAKKTDEVPVKLNNPNWVKPFEFFIDMYSTPKYGEIDPTFFVFLTFPLFFGFMLGDFGYGIVGFLLFYFLKKRFSKSAAGFFNVLLLSCVTSIIFGLLYGEFFGLEEMFGFVLPHLLSRAHEVFNLLYIAIGIGIVHINIGLIIGFINEKSSKGLAKAIYKKGSWILLQIGVALLALSYMSIINLGPIVGYIFLIVSLILLFMGEGALAIIELPGMLSNILSYARLMAIGLASVSLATVVNGMASGFFQKGGFSILAGILIIIIGHTINIVLGLFGSFLHSLRLHYVEFFGKFFQGGAEKYRPFGIRE